MPFSITNGMISAITGKDSPTSNIQDASGLALCLTGNDLEGGMYLMTDNQTVNVFVSDVTKTQNLTSLLSSLLTNSYAHHHKTENPERVSPLDIASSAAR